MEHYTYDYAGNITGATDANGNTITYRYNSLGQVCEIRDPEGHSEYFYCDEEGRQEMHVDRGGNTEYTRYNMDGSLYYRRCEDRNGKHPVVSQYRYRPDGRLREASGGGITYQYTYTENGLLESKSASGKSLLEYTYDRNRNLSGLTDRTGRTIHYRYDALDRLMQVTEGPEHVLASYHYHKGGPLQTLYYGNGLQTEYHYQEDGSPAGLVTMTAQGKVLLNLRYAYDGNGNCTEKSGEPYQNTYTYDRMNRLTGSIQDGKGVRYAYDPAGNRLKKETGQETETYRYNGKNQLTERHTREGVIRYNYDLQGNLLEEQGETRRKQYAYDAAGRQISVVVSESAGGGDKERSFVQLNRYDGEGLRYETEENGKVIRFLFDRGELAEESIEDAQIRYIRGYDPLLLIHQDGDEQSRFSFVQDEAGSILFLLDKAHKIRKSYHYDTFGSILQEAGDVSNRLTYTGQIYDGVAGQYYLRARFYNPVIGRFLQEDVYRGDGLNLYAYCANNPVMYYDPSGYAQLCPGGKTNPTRKDLVPDMIQGPNGTMISKEYDQLVYGGYYTNKEYNRMRFEAQPGNYDKHIKALTINQAMELSYKAAQFAPGVDSAALVYKAMFEGIPVLHGNSTIYYFYDTGSIIGYDCGQATTWIRAELSSGFYHGHPMSLDRLSKYIVVCP